MGEINCDLLTGENIFCAFVRFCDTTKEKITKVKPPSHSHENFYEKVTHIVFYKGTLTCFPSELGEFFPNLKYLDFFECGMEKISKNDLKNFPKLEKLKLESNKLKFLPSNLFDFTPEISVLNFADNQLKAIGESLLDNLPHLKEANFKGNSSLNYKFCLECGSDLGKLKEIIKIDCKPVRSLMDLTVDALMNSIESQNDEEVKIIAKCLRIDKLTKIVNEK